ncbi:uncharacterized protein LY79DRAFT_578444 [Colletotrichum navitas]|uniref:Uncharacterized protein n=1 Tax=Colletotrichum navitas TaxID=681940 RepID=A0AAD8V5C1_9PEZI|nr:uncharacterized protein LY79DRAFT_578444 [Colletotrichum navitas]KAK1594857.1 hypothetical protein LY79DRAFT_578444 [Colletotrichum navitas]
MNETVLVAANVLYAVTAVEEVRCEGGQDLRTAPTSPSMSSPNNPLGYGFLWSSLGVLFLHYSTLGGFHNSLECSSTQAALRTSQQVLLSSLPQHKLYMEKKDGLAPTKSKTLDPSMLEP